MPRIPRLTYGNVAATLALFVALGGTATAAVALAPDSVGSAQIQRDAVRSPEIEADAVRSPEIEADAVRSSEIEADAVRSSEIRDESILLADISPGARSALDAPKVRSAEEGTRTVPTCSSIALSACPNLISVRVPAGGSWLIHAGIEITGFFSLSGEVCGLVQSDSNTIAVAHNIGLGLQGAFGGEQVVLSDVLTTAPSGESTVVALRCIKESGTDNLTASTMTLTALEVAPVAAD